MKGLRRMFLSVAAVAVPIAVVSCYDSMTAASFTDEQRLRIFSVVGGVSESPISASLSELDGIRTNVEENNDLSGFENRIVSRFRGYGYADVVLQPVTTTHSDYWGSAVAQRTMDNIVVTKPGADPGLPAVVVCAHWDSISGGRGMDDNASGTAGVIETSRVLSGIELRRTVVFVLTAYEEIGMLGAERFASGLSAAPDSVINLDMIGFTSSAESTYFLEDFMVGMPDTGDFIQAVALNRCRGLAYDFAHAADEFVPALKFHYMILPDNAGTIPVLVSCLQSDHIVFWQRLIPALFLGDTSAAARGGVNHTTEDTIDTLNIPFMANVVRAIAATVCIRADPVP